MTQKLFEEYKQVEEQYQIPAGSLNNADRRYIVGKYSEMMTEEKMTIRYRMS